MSKSIYNMEAGKTEWGVSRRDGERDREEQIRREREGALMAPVHCMAYPVVKSLFPLT
jgi:hypothetical protein